MMQLLLWFNIMAFTLMVTSMGAAYVVYSRHRAVWLPSYLVYMACYTLFLIIITYKLFCLIYLPASSPVLDIIVFWLNPVSSVVLLLSVPLFVRRILAERPGAGLIITNAVVEVFILALLLTALFSENAIITGTANFVFNIYFGIISLYAVIQIRRRRAISAPGVVIPFIYSSCTAYFILAGFSIVCIFMTPDTHNIANVTAGGLFSSIWGALTLGYLMTKIPGQAVVTDGGIPAAFIKQYGITDREKDIIPLLLEGICNRDIGEKLFVSRRTVDTHVYNIYRKCSVGSKLELVNLVTISKTT